jgi:hypothetical protein
MMKRISGGMRLEEHRLLSKPQKIELKHSMILEEVKKRLWIVGPSLLLKLEEANK